MSIELTDAKRYDLEKDRIITHILYANRAGMEIDDKYLSKMLNIDLADVNRVLTTLHTENIIK